MTVVFRRGAHGCHDTVPPHEARGSGRLHRRLETWLWTGPVGHLLGGGLDVAQGLRVYLRSEGRAAVAARAETAARPI